MGFSTAAYRARSRETLISDQTRSPGTRQLMLDEFSTVQLPGFREAPIHARDR